MGPCGCSLCRGSPSSPCPGPQGVNPAPASSDAGSTASPTCGVGLQVSEGLRARRPYNNKGAAPTITKGQLQAGGRRAGRAGWPHVPTSPPGRPYHNKAAARRAGPAAEPMFTCHPTKTKPRGPLPEDTRAIPSGEVTLHKRPPPQPFPGAGSTGAGRRLVPCSVPFARLREGASSPPVPPTRSGRSPRAALPAVPPARPGGTCGAAGPGSCSMLTAGQRCYSGPAAGWALADRVSLSNASRAPAAGGATRQHPQRHPAAPSQAPAGG